MEKKPKNVMTDHVADNVGAANSYPINADRQELGEIVPIATPFVIYFEPTRFCNLKCKFCSNPMIPDSHRVSMDRGLYEKMISDLSQFPDKIKVLSINGVGEPLCHKDICDFIRLAKDAGRVEKIRLITNGVLLSPELNTSLIDAGLDMLWISVEAMSSEGYREIAGDVDFEKLVENIRDFYSKRRDCKLYVKIVDAGLKDKQEERLFYDTFQHYCDNILVEHISNIYSDVQSAMAPINRFTGEELQYYDICDYMFKGISVNADGTCSPCPVDWKGELLLGDLHENTLWEIWSGDRLRHLQRQILQGDIKSIHACKDCCLYLNAESSIQDIKSLSKCRKGILERLERNPLSFEA